MATVEEFDSHIDSMSAEDFEHGRSQCGDPRNQLTKESIKQKFKQDMYPHNQEFLCRIFGILTETEKYTKANVAIAAAAQQSAEIAKEALEFSRISADAAQKSAAAAETMARIAEEANASARRSAWKADLSLVISIIVGGVTLGQYIIGLTKK